MSLFKSFDYQSVRHCSKTKSLATAIKGSLITSQFDTAPKLAVGGHATVLGLITSQFDTAPKLGQVDTVLALV